MINKIPDIDIVYLWVDGNDPAWIEKKIKCTGIHLDSSDVDCRGRYVDNDELKFSLRSIEMYAPWIRKVFIVTDNQIPAWLNTSHPRVTVVDHSQILPTESLPCFNATVIEHYIYRIPDLSEYFLFANDDTFLNKKTNPTDFFNNQGQFFIRLRRKILGRWQYPIKKILGKELGHYRTSLMQSALVVKNITGKFYSGIPHHNIDAFQKSYYKDAVENVFREEVALASISHVRTKGDIHRSAFSYYFLAKGYGKCVYVNNYISARLLPYKHNLVLKLKKYNPTFLCVNDDQNSKANHKEAVVAFLETIFPQKSSFEK